jgi:hypothetical protein
MPEIKIADKPTLDEVNQNQGKPTDAASSTGTTKFSLVKFIVARFTGFWTDARAALLDRLDTTISSRATQTSVDTKASQASVDSIDTKLGVNTAAAGTATVFARLRQIFDVVETMAGSGVNRTLSPSNNVKLTSNTERQSASAGQVSETLKAFRVNGTGIIRISMQTTSFNTAGTSGTSQQIWVNGVLAQNTQVGTPNGTWATFTYDIPVNQARNIIEYKGYGSGGSSIGVRNMTLAWDEMSGGDTVIKD